MGDAVVVVNVADGGNEVVSLLVNIEKCVSLGCLVFSECGAEHFLAVPVKTGRGDFF